MSSKLHHQQQKISSNILHELNQAEADLNVGQYFCVGSNHRTADISIREKFYLKPEQILQILTPLAQAFQIEEIAVLSTCNRCEIYGFAPKSLHLSQNFLTHLYRCLHEDPNSLSQSTLNQNFTESTYGDSLYSFTGIDAVKHSFQVISSLDSLILGETQITGQFKDAFALAKTAGTLGSKLHRLSQEALATAKKIRTQTGIGKHKISISHAAIDLAKRASDDLSQLRFLIIGAGEMARVAAEYAVSYKPKNLFVVNRNRQRAFELTEHLGFGEAHSLDNLVQLMAQSDVVISATSATGHVIQKADVKKSMKSRSDGALFLIDIALPRDIEPDVGDLDDVYLFDIDDLKTVVDSHIEKRKEAMGDAINIVQSSVQQFSNWINRHEISPTFAASQKYFSSVLQKECSKTLSKELFLELTPKQRDALNSMMEAISSRFTGDIAKSFKDLPPNEARVMADALNQIFNRDS